MKRGSISSRLIVGAVLVLALVAAADALRPGPASDSIASPQETVTIPETEHAGGTSAIDRIGLAWARRFASTGLEDCYHTSQELCARLHCSQVGLHKVANCRLPTRAYRRSFRAAEVDGVVIVHDEAVAKFSNGEMIRLHADRRTWWVLALGRDVGRGFFEKPG